MCATGAAHHPDHCNPYIHAPDNALDHRPASFTGKKKEVQGKVCICCIPLPETPFCTFPQPYLHNYSRRASGKALLAVPTTWGLVLLPIDAGLHSKQRCSFPKGHFTFAHPFRSYLLHPGGDRDSGSVIFTSASES